MSRPTGLTLVPPTPASELSAVHRLAVCHGAIDTGCGSGAEREQTPLKLLTLVAWRLPDLALSTFVVQSLAGDVADARLAAVIEQLRRQAAGVVRLSHRALETHARNVGYGIDEWCARILESGSALLYVSHTAEARGEHCATPLAVVREATSSICHALAACENDRMAVPEHLSEASARLLLVFMLAGELRAPTMR